MFVVRTRSPGAPPSYRATRRLELRADEVVASGDVYFAAGVDHAAAAIEAVKAGEIAPLTEAETAQLTTWLAESVGRMIIDADDRLAIQGQTGMAPGTVKTDPPKRGARTSIQVRASPEFLGAIDAWIAAHSAGTVTRAEALRQIATEALQGLGLFDEDAATARVVRETGRTELGLEIEAGLREAINHRKARKLPPPR